VHNLSDVILVSGRTTGQRAILKFSQTVGATSTSSSRWIPGTLTNQNTLKFKEPRVLVVTDPKQDKQAIIEASYVNIPCIALCNTDAPLDYVDVVIPCNNRDTKAISMVYWLLAREVQVLRGKLRRDEKFNVMVDLFFHRDAEMIKTDDVEDNEEGEPKKEWDVVAKDHENLD
jgi:small subunit ribosomal protein SAe